MSTLDRPDANRTVSKDEQIELRARIISADVQLERIAHYRNEPDGQWPQDIREWFSHSPVAGESPAQVLQRWWGLFEDEVNLVHQVRNRVVHYAAVKDAELLNAAWLIERLMRTLESTGGQNKGTSGARTRVYDRCRSTPAERRRSSASGYLSRLRRPTTRRRRS